MQRSGRVLQFKRGDHVCVFYHDANSLLGIVASYVEEGLNNGERCFCAQQPHMIPQLLQALELRGVDTGSQIKRGALEILSHDEVYFVDGRFAPHAMTTMLERSIEDALQRGFTGFRTSGEMGWALDAKYGDKTVLCDQIISYEEMVARSYPGKPAVAMCQYPAMGFAPQTLRKVMEYHRSALEERIIGTNHSALSITRGNYSADIVTDRLTRGSVYHYVLQKRGSAEVLNWGQEHSMAAAIATTEALLADYD